MTEAVKEAGSLGMVARRPWGLARRLLEEVAVSIRPGLWAGRDGARGRGFNTTEFITAWNFLTCGELENTFKNFSSCFALKRIHPNVN